MTTEDPSAEGAPTLRERDPLPPDPAAAARRPATSLLTWGTVALVLVIAVVLVVVKLTGAPPVSTPSAATGPTPAPAPVVKAVTTIPASVYDAVGVRSPVASVVPPALLHGQPALTARSKPEVVFVGDEFSPYSAAEGWALVAALSRFGTFGDTLYSTQSGSNEAFPGTPTFAFDGTRYRSRYLSATLVEHYGDQKNGSGTAYAVLEPLPGRIRTLLARYDRQTSATVPFVDVANVAVVTGGEFSPSIFQQLSVNEIATGLADPKDPATQAIVASANYLSAAICRADGGRPARVCTSRGVRAAQRALEAAG